MKKLIINKVLFLIVFWGAMEFSGTLKGATVEWDVSQVYYDHSAIGDSGMLFTIGRPFLNIYAEVVGSSLLLRALPDSNLASANTYAVASKGDIVSREYMDGKGEYFAWAQYNNPNVHTDYSILLNDSENIYLAFIADYGTFDTPRYGWVELGLDEDGLLKAYSSAWDIDGDSIIVGDVPEPTSGLLLIFGLAVLSLRRRKKFA